MSPWNDVTFNQKQFDMSNHLVYSSVKVFHENLEVRCPVVQMVKKYLKRCHKDLDWNLSHSIDHQKSLDGGIQSILLFFFPLNLKQGLLVQCSLTTEWWWSCVVKFKLWWRHGTSWQEFRPNQLYYIHHICGIGRNGKHIWQIFFVSSHLSLITLMNRAILAFE